MLTRQNRRPPAGAITKSVSMTEVMADRVSHEAEKQGHFNFSAIINEALIEYFERRDTEDAAEPKAKVA